MKNPKISEMIQHNTDSAADDDTMTIHAPESITFDAVGGCRFRDQDAVHCEVMVHACPGRAPSDTVPSRYLRRWWPRDMTWSGEALEHLFLEGRKGGMLWERGPDGLRLDCARVMRWLPPEKFMLRWHIGPGRVPQPDIARTSEVEIQFGAEDEGHTRVVVDHHRGFARNHPAQAAMRVSFPDGVRQKVAGPVILGMLRRALRNCREPAAIPFTAGAESLECKVAAQLVRCRSASFY